MTHELTDNADASVTVALERGEPVSAYIVNVAGERAGRAEFIDSPDVDGERIFFHTEVDERFGGRGLAGLLVREALADSIRENLTVVPVCPLFARHLNRHGEDFFAEGGVFHRPTPSDIALVARAVRHTS